MNTAFHAAIQEINTVKKWAHYAYVTLSIARSLAVASIVTSLWFIVEPNEPILGILIGVLTIVLLISFVSFRTKHQIHLQNFLLSLDMNHQASQVSPFLAIESEANTVRDDWASRLAREIKRVKALEARRLTAISSSLAVPLLVTFLLWSKALPTMKSLVADAQGIASLFNPTQSLQIITGALDQSLDGKFVKLTSSPVDIVLLPQNMLRLTVNDHHKAERGDMPFIKLKPLVPSLKSLPTDFQMNQNYDQDGQPAGWKLDFSTSQSSELILNASREVVIARIEVKNLPLPEVELTLNSKPVDPWPDQTLVPLGIKVKAHHPLRKIQLKFRAKDKESHENVASIMNETTLSYDDEYRLNLEPHMAEDFMEFEITAEAIDRAQPQPLTGVSNPILIRAASAYGRYKATLATLGKIRTQIDSAAGDIKADLSPEVNRLADEAIQQAETSPFFDTLDRMTLSRIFDDLKSLPNESRSQKTSKIIDISSQLGNFLFEHEVLDDRERDRDFFIAARTLSRVLSTSASLRPVPIKNLTDRMTTFLDQRQQRWRKRVERLGEKVSLPSWPKIRDLKPFHTGIDDVRQLDSQEKQSLAQGAITKATNQFKTWLDELEAKEDEARQKKDQEQQQGLANARNELREIQQRQDQISNALDRAATRPQEDLESKWQSARPQQNSNTKQAAGLLDQLRALSPNAGERLKAAIGAMDETLAQGNKENFKDAESAADIAGRLLRDAEQSAARSQQQQRDRGRRKRTSGDDYFGNTVVGGDVETKTDYQVDPRYREEILRDAAQAGETKSDKLLLDNYLRQILR